MLVTADAEMRRAGISAQLEQADIHSIPYADQTFDVVMAAHVLEHLPEPQNALSEMMRVLKPGGVLFICMTRRSVFGTFIQLRWRTWAVSERQGVTWLRDLDLENIGVQPISLGPCVGQASTAFWARKPVEAFTTSQTEPITQNEESIS
jgi:demethylmenaquinone methyltransferase/2-methoxy-6-polyprenyl-1,4-benzoquinol methylase